MIALPDLHICILVLILAGSEVSLLGSFSILTVVVE